MMKRTLHIMAALLLMNAIVRTQSRPGSLEITLKHSDQREIQTRDQLQRLMTAYDLSKWIFTRKIVIDSDRNVIPHSHPVLTLSVRRLKDDELLLSTFVHEQLHWFLTQRRETTEAVMKELRQLYPKIPVGAPEGARDEESGYLHLIVNYLEYRAAQELLGELKARQVMEFWSNDHYTWIYRTVLSDGRQIGRLLFQHKLVPGAQN
jgi:hypothetical protein